MRKPQFGNGRRRVIIVGISALAMVGLAAGTMLSMALFTDQQQDNETFTTGTILLDATKVAALNLANGPLMPGDAISSSVTVENDGTAQLRYAVSQTSTNPDTKSLRDSIMLTVRTEDTGGGAFGTDGNYCDDASGTVLRASAAIGATGNLVGNPTQGSQAGDRTLGAGANEVLCFYITLDIDAPNTSQGATTTTTFTFAAEQTANN